MLIFLVFIVQNNFITKIQIRNFRCLINLINRKKNISLHSNVANFKPIFICGFQFSCDVYVTYGHNRDIYSYNQF